MCTENFTYTKKFYVHEIAAVILSKIFFLKNAKKKCKPNNCDLNRDWKIILNFKTVMKIIINTLCYINRFFKLISFPLNSNQNYVILVGF